MVYATHQKSRIMLLLRTSIEVAEVSNDPFDATIGSNIRLARLAAKMSQTDLGEKIGITFQQIQKYETGANRVGAGRLLRIANVLDIPVNAFYRDLEQSSRPNPTVQFLQKRDAFTLAEAFDKITNRRVRNSLVALVRDIATRRKTNKPRTIRRNTRRPARKQRSPEGREPYRT